MPEMMQTNPMITRGTQTSTLPCEKGDVTNGRTQSRVLEVIRR